MSDFLLGIYVGGALCAAMTLRPPMVIWARALPLWILTAAIWPVAAVVSTGFNKDLDGTESDRLSGR